MGGSWKSFLCDCHNDCESINTFTFASEWKGTDAWRHLAKWVWRKSVENKIDCSLVVISDEINYFRRMLSGKQLQLIFMKRSCISLNQFIHSFAGCVDYKTKIYWIFCWCINKPARYGWNFQWLYDFNKKTLHWGFTIWRENYEFYDLYWRLLHSAKSFIFSTFTRTTLSTF